MEGRELELSFRKVELDVIGKYKKGDKYLFECMKKNGVHLKLLISPEKPYQMNISCPHPYFFMIDKTIEDYYDLDKWEKIKTDIKKFRLATSHTLNLVFVAESIRKNGRKVIEYIDDDLSDAKSLAKMLDNIRNNQ